MAKQKGWRRPWDGPDGRDFEEYQNEGRDENNKIKTLAGRDGPLPGTKKRDDDSSDSSSDEDDTHLEVSEGLSNQIKNLLSAPSFDWADTQDMSIYKNDPYEKYTKAFGGRIFRMMGGIGKQFQRLVSIGLDKAGL